MGMADEEDAPNPPRNYSDDLEDMKARGSGVLAIDEDSETGILTILTQAGHYDFLIDQELANIIVQQLREFIRGDSDKLPEA
jgi:hypothetical protein